MQRSRFFTLQALVLGTLLLTGCGGEKIGDPVNFSGKVTLDDKPFSAASIQFTDIDSGANYPVDLNADGTYTVEVLDTHEGDSYGVSFGPIIKPPATVKLDGAGLPLGNPAPPISEKYFEYTTSGLEVKIGSEETQTFDANLQSK